jgi:hypothetical protein
MAIFNIDEMKSGYAPVDIVFRSAEYRLGANALGVLEACDIHASIEGKDGVQYMRALLELLPRMVRSLCPTLDLDGMELETGEQMALMHVCTEVLGRIGRLSFQEAAGTGVA